MTDTALRRRVRGWMMFDFASQPFYTLCLTFVFGPYLAGVLAEAYRADGLDPAAANAAAQSLWSGTQTWIGVAIALSAPVMGALADRAARRMPWIWAFSVLYVVGTAGLWLMVPDASQTTLALIAFALAMVGAEMTTLYTNAMLPSLGPPGEVGRISGSGYALGYAGGVAALFIMLLVFAENEAGVTLLGNPPPFGLDPEAREGTRFVGPFTALWFAVFMIPFFLWVREPRAPALGRLSLRGAVGDVVTLVRALPGRPSLTAFLLGSMLYRDGLVALYAFGGVYARLVLDWSTVQIGIFGIVAAITAAIASWVGGRLDRRFGPKPVIVGAVLSLTGALLAICFTDRTMVLGLPVAEGSGAPDMLLYVTGAVIGGAGGVVQAASRTMMALHANPARPTEAFGLYALSGKATAFLAPAMIWIGTEVTGSARLGYLPVAGLFIAGLVLLAWVRPKGESDTWSAPPSSA
ncbi:MFS transporter [Jannaschia seohaensis]|uniref:MFS transporter, UMF1 family n=1 Tax=Jannaschia seohaensis TaxID=475081 RepID=A0A2Y9B162_9RHOB|nr:MFS transporter [Jannaschia seohaensis]PWJ16197.1 UMF1 family MFS transporter [Jannaschia seohaensis]SSA49218.1 MFS transporter, UMF1 family [Jannaschia seohaensis]